MLSNPFLPKIGIKKLLCFRPNVTPCHADWPLLSAFASGPWNNTGTMPEDIYRIKTVQYKNQRVPILMQNLNGPCPLLAISKRSPWYTDVPRAFKIVARIAVLILSWNSQDETQRRQHTSAAKESAHPSRQCLCRFRAAHSACRRLPCRQQPASSCKITYLHCAHSHICVCVCFHVKNNTTVFCSCA